MNNKNQRVGELSRVPAERGPGSVGHSRAAGVKILQIASPGALCFSSMLLAQVSGLSEPSLAGGPQQHSGGFAGIAATVKVSYSVERVQDWIAWAQRSLPFPSIRARDMKWKWIPSCSAFARGGTRCSGCDGPPARRVNSEEMCELIFPRSCSHITIFPCCTVSKSGDDVVVCQGRGRKRPRRKKRD